MTRIGLTAGITAFAVGLCLLPAQLSASTITGSFNIDGSITATVNTITWADNANTPQMATITTSGLTGSFTGLGNTEVTIRNLSNPPDVVDSSGFPNTLFISFNAAPSFPQLMLNFIYPGVASPAQCATLPPLGGQTCTPPITGGSPFTFTNLGTPGGTPTGSSAAFAFSGVTSDGMGTWTANLTSQFSVPYQTVLSQLASSGSVTNSYSGTVTVSSATVPEPNNTLVFIFGGVFLLIGGLRRKSVA